MPPKLYWTLAGYFQPYSASIEGQQTPEAFYRLGNYELDLFQKLGVLKKQAKTLEIGCGPGRIQHALVHSQVPLEVFGTDFSSSMIAKAKKAVPEGHFSVGNGRDLHQYKDSFFDLVYSFVVFQHVDEEIFARYLKESYRVLRPGGFLVFQIQPMQGGGSSYQRPRRHPWLLRRYHRSEIMNLLQEAGFRRASLYDMHGRLSPKQVNKAGLLVLAQKPTAS